MWRSFSYHGYGSRQNSDIPAVCVQAANLVEIGGEKFLQTNHSGRHMIWNWNFTLESNPQMKSIHI